MTKLVKMLADRDRLLAEVDAVRSAVLEDNPKQNKGLIKMIDRVQELDKYIRQHENRIQGIKQRQKTADNSIRRKQDSKRKILMGALVEHLMETNMISKTFILDELDNFLLQGHYPSYYVYKNIEERHKRNLHKVKPMPSCPRYYSTRDWEV